MGCDCNGQKLKIKTKILKKWCKTSISFHILDILKVILLFQSVVWNSKTGSLEFYLSYLFAMLQKDNFGNVDLTDL